MTTAHVNGVRLFYELVGTSGVPYDRRGHSESERPCGQGSVRDDVADLAALVEHLELAPAWVAGVSFGATIALRLAGERPELLRGVIGHEPMPLFSLVADDPTLIPMVEDAGRQAQAVAQRIASGDHAGAAGQFVEMALGPGSWRQLPPTVQHTMVENAPTYLDEVNDPE